MAAPNLVFAERNNNTATLFFTAPPGVTSYNVYRGTASGQETLLASNVTASPYTDSTLQTGVTYYYYVTAVNANAVPAANESAPSNEASPASGGGGTSSGPAAAPTATGPLRATGSAASRPPATPMRR